MLLGGKENTGNRSRQMGFNIDQIEVSQTRPNLFNSKPQNVGFVSNIYNAGLGAHSINLSKSLENHNNMNGDRKYYDII